MKKILALVLAVLMMATLSVCAFADVIPFGTGNKLRVFCSRECSSRLTDIRFLEESMTYQLSAEEAKSELNKIRGTLNEFPEKATKEFYIGVISHLENNATIVGFYLNEKFVPLDTEVTVYPDEKIYYAWSDEFETPDEVWDVIDGSAFAITAPEKENAETGSSVAPVIALSALVVLAGAAVVASKKR